MALALDGSVSAINFFGTTKAAALTTTQSNDVIIVDVTLTGGPVVSVTASGLSFINRATAYNAAIGIERWYAIAASPLSAVSITVTSTVNGNLMLTAYGISGANTSSPFQVASVTGASATPGIDPLSITATEAAFIAAAYYSNATASLTTGSGLTVIVDGNTSANNECIEYKIVAVSGAVSCTLTTGAGNANAGIIDAIDIAGASLTLSPQPMVLM